MRDACEASEPVFEERLRATAGAFVALAGRNPALLELMYSGRPGGEAPGPESAAAGAMSVVRGLIDAGIADGVLAPRDPRSYALLLLSWVRGIAALVTSGMIGPETADELIADSVRTFIRGSA
jgi:hypothetical protein